MDLSNSDQIANSILTALSGKNYLLAIAVALVGAVKGIRWIAPKLHDAAGTFLNSDRGGAILSLVMGVAGGAATSLAAGKPLSLSLILSGIMVSATGSGIFNLTKRVVNPSDKPAAPKPPGATGTVPAAVVLFLVGLTSLSGCGFCSVAANKDTARCKAEAVGVDCAAPEAAKIIEDIAARVGSALASNDYSTLLDSILADLQKQGRTDGLGLLTCAINKSMNKPAAGAVASAMVERAKSYKTAHPVKIK